MRGPEWKSFCDEFLKIAAARANREDSDGPEPGYYATNAAAGVPRDGNPGWEQKDIPETPARKANNMLGLPLQARRRGQRKYEEDWANTAAHNDDRGAGPASGDTSAQAAQTAKAHSTQMGPGGV